MAKNQKIYDLIIVGGSAAATAAGIYAARRKLNFKILTKEFGGEVATAGEIDNYPGIPNTNGIELSEKFHQHLKKYNVAIEEGVEVDSISKKGDLFCLAAKSNEGEKKALDKLKPLAAKKTCDYLSKTVIVATGVHPRELNVPGEKEFRGKGLSYCTVCDGPLFKDKIVATVGGGNSALESALMLSEIAKKVYLINKNPTFKGEPVLIDKVKNSTNVQIIYNALTQEIKGDKFVNSLIYKDAQGNLQEIKVAGVFIHIGMVPNSSLVNDLAEKNNYGEIKVNQLCQTKTPGLFAAGDVTDMPYKQIGIAVGQGICAVLSAVDYLNKLTKLS